MVRVQGLASEDVRRLNPARQAYDQRGAGIVRKPAKVTHGMLACALLLHRKIIRRPPLSAENGEATLAKSVAQSLCYDSADLFPPPFGIETNEYLDSIC